MVELGATWAKQAQERAHGVKRVFHQAVAPQVKQAVPRWALSYPGMQTAPDECLLQFKTLSEGIFAPHNPYIKIQI